MIDFKVGCFYKFIPSNKGKGFYICKVLEDYENKIVAEVILDTDNSGTKFQIGRKLNFDKDRKNEAPFCEYIKEEDVFLEVL